MVLNAEKVKKTRNFLGVNNVKYCDVVKKIRYSMTSLAPSVYHPPRSIAPELRPKMGQRGGLWGGP